MYCNFSGRLWPKNKRECTISGDFHRNTYKYIYLHLIHLIYLIHPHINPHHLQQHHLHPSSDMKQELCCVAALYQAEFSSPLEIQTMCKDMYMYL